MISKWAYEALGGLKEDSVTIASGLSPSGEVHVGNLREVLTADFLYRAAINSEYTPTQIMSWDDFDRFRKVPEDIPKSFSEHIGKPYREVPDPFGEYESYGKRFEVLFEEVAEQLDIQTEFKSQYDNYKSGMYDRDIVNALRSRREISDIIEGFMTQDLTEEQKNKFYPVSVYSRFTGKDNTRITDYNGDTKISYVCLDTGKTDTIDFSQDRQVKLGWKIDWPMRWNYEGVDIEPGGRDHASQGGSFDVSSVISEEIFNNKPPKFIPYEFVKIQGENKKISSSEGSVITPQNMLEIYSPEVIRWMYTRQVPSSQIQISFEPDSVYRIYDEFDTELKRGLSKDNKALISVGDGLKPKPPFRHLEGIGINTGFTWEKARTLLHNDNHPTNKETEKRFRRIQTWRDKYKPKETYNIQENSNSSFLKSLSGKEREDMRSLEELIEQKDKLSRKDISSEIYQIPKRDYMSNEDKKKSQKEFFKNAYTTLFGRKKGPRLATFIWAADKKKLIEPFKE